MTSPNIGNYIQNMKDHTLIGKFMGIWPSAKALMRWVSTRWKIKGQVDLKLGFKGFFTTIFSNPSDRNKVLDEGPYFFNSTGLHLCYWVERFSPENEDFMAPSVWIRIYSLPQGF